MPPCPPYRTAGTFATGVLAPLCVTSHTGPTFSVMSIRPETPDGASNAVIQIRSPDVATADAAYDAITAGDLVPPTAATAGRCIEVALDDGRLLYAHGTIPRLGRQVAWRHH